MEDIFFVTGNYDKFLEAKKILEKEGINLLKSDLKVVEKKLETIHDISVDKALTSSRMLKKPLIVEDTGIFFKAYNGFPGTNPNFVFKTIGYKGILKLLEGKNRGAYFETVVSFWEPGSQVVSFSGICEGKIAEKVSSVIGFAYDAIFIPNGEKKATFSEMTKEEKEKYSHRAKALQEFVRWYRKRR